MDLGGRSLGGPCDCVPALPDSVGSAGRTMRREQLDFPGTWDSRAFDSEDEMPSWDRLPRVVEPQGTGDTTPPDHHSKSGCQ